MYHFVQKDNTPHFIKKIFPNELKIRGMENISNLCI